MPEPIDIAEARRLLDEATPGPWELAGDRNQWGEERVIASDGEMAKPLFVSRRAEAGLIVWARNNLPALLDRIESLEADLERAHLARAEAQNRASDLRKAADGWASHAEKTESALFEARATNTRLNRRCQLAEKAARENIDACKRAGMSFGRSLANYAALLYREDLERAQATIARVRTLSYASDDGSEYEHNGHAPHEGEPECPACWADGILAALDGDQ